jgi:hypothetical protein
MRSRFDRAARMTAAAPRSRWPAPLPGNSDAAGVMPSAAGGSGSAASNAEGRPSGPLMSYRLGSPSRLTASLAAPVAASRMKSSPVSKPLWTPMREDLGTSGEAACDSYGANALIEAIKSGSQFLTDGSPNDHTPSCPDPTEMVPSRSCHNCAEPR